MMLEIVVLLGMGAILTATLVLAAMYAHSAKLRVRKIGSVERLYDQLIETLEEIRDKVESLQNRETTSIKEVNPPEVRNNEA